MSCSMRNSGFSRRGLEFGWTSRRPALLAFACREGWLAVTDARAVTGLAGPDVRKVLSTMVVQGLFRPPETGDTFRLADHLSHMGGALADDKATSPSSENSNGRSATPEGEPETDTGKAPDGETGTDKESDHGDQVGSDLSSDHVPLRLTKRQRTILGACDVPRSLTELMERAGVSHRTHFRNKHLNPLLGGRLIRMTNPENPRASNQKYVLTETGAALKAAGATA